MANSEFTHEEATAFGKMVAGFEDGLQLIPTVDIETVDQEQMERTGNVIWVPQPYIMQSHEGTDATDKYQGANELAVPLVLNKKRFSAWEMTEDELRVATREGNLRMAATRKLASDVNQDISDFVTSFGTLVVKRTSAATGFDDMAAAEAMMNETGVPHGDRWAALSTRDYNGMASDLAKADRSFGNSISDAAFRKAYVGDVAGFQTLKLDYSARKTAAAGSGITIDTRVAGAQFYTPRSTSTAVTGEKSNVDNRFQRVTVSSTTGVVAGDCFTIANVQSVHMENKQATGQLKTFRVITVDSATTMTISPPIISAQGGTDAEINYQNVSVASTSATAAITFLNTTTAALNPFWYKNAVKLSPAVTPEGLAGGGPKLLRVRLGRVPLEVTMMKDVDIDTRKVKFRVDVRYGVNVLAPEMCGVILFGQA